MMRQVHKFGGASVRDAQAVRNVGRIVDDLCTRGIHPIVVVSAMAKSTNALEAIWSALPYGGDWQGACSAFLDFHASVAAELGLPTELLDADVAAFKAVAQRLTGQPADDEAYDALVGFGERFSTRLVHAHLAQRGLRAVWQSAWQWVKTDAHHRAAVVDVPSTGTAVRAALERLGEDVAVTQGFVGGSADGKPTTLGREGSDYTGALLAEASGAERLVVWKDVEGVMTGDPRRWPLAEKVNALDHATAERMSRAGAGVLHPSTMAPLQRSGIPLEVRSFQHPDRTGTVISSARPDQPLPRLWAFEGEGDRTVVRCVTGSPQGVVDEWNRAFPERPAVGTTADPDIPGCFQLGFTH